MRYSRLITSAVLATLICFLLIVPSSAVATEQKIIIDSCEASYKNQYFQVYYPQVNRDNYVFPQIKNPYDGDVDNPPALSSVTLLGYTDPYIDWKEGYIYTFNYTVAVALVQEDVYPTITLALATTTSSGTIAQYSPIGDVTYTYTKTGTQNQGFTYTYTITSVVKVDSSFNNGNIEDYNLTYVALTIDGIFQHSSANVTVLSNRMKVTKSIGEDAYYQASIDAIEGLPQSEYDYIYNSMPDEAGEVEVIKGKFIQILGVFDQDIALLLSALNTDIARPCIYLPRVIIPILDIEVWEAQIFYVDDYLDSLNPNIMVALDPMLYFIRMVVFFGFATFTIYKMIRLEWWL